MLCLSLDLCTAFPEVVRQPTAFIITCTIFFSCFMSYVITIHTALRARVCERPGMCVTYLFFWQRTHSVSQVFPSVPHTGSNSLLQLLTSYLSHSGCTNMQMHFKMATNSIQQTGSYSSFLICFKIARTCDWHWDTFIFLKVPKRY